jgi:transcriptional regulator with XRE-family HTH domain
MRFHEKLRILRERQNLSRRQLGENIGLSYNFIYELEHGKSRPNVSHLVKISDFFRVSMDVLARDELELDAEDDP